MMDTTGRNISIGQLMITWRVIIFITTHRFLKQVLAEKDLANNYLMHGVMSEMMIGSDVLVSLPEIGGPTTNADRQVDVDMGQADSNVLVTATRVFRESHDFLIFLSDAKTIAKL